MLRIVTLARKDLRVLLRDKGTWFWIIGFPLLVALFFGTIFSSGGDGFSGMTVAAVDEDSTDFSRAYIAALDSTDELTVIDLARDSALERIRQGKLTAAVIIKDGFGQTHGLFSDSPMVEVGIDPARRMEAGFLQGILTRTLFMVLQKKYASLSAVRGGLQEWIDEPGAWEDLSEKNAAAGKEILRKVQDLTREFEDSNNADTSKSSAATDSGQSSDLFRVKMTSVTTDRFGPRSAFEVTFPSSLLWALIATSAAFGVSIVQERTGGTMLRLRLAPITRAHILAGKGLACFAAGLLTCILLLAIGVLFFDVRVSNLSVLAIAVVASCLCFVGITMMISVLGKTEEAVGGAGWGILLVAAMTGGGMIPVFIMPGWLRTLSNFSPVKWGILAIEGGIWRDFSLSDAAGPIAVLLGIGTACFLAGVIIMSRVDR